MSPEIVRTTIRFGLAVAVVGSLGWHAHVMHERIFGVDDAHIAFVYGQNLADGYGFVYNRGGERVEGFTSMLWVLTAASMFILTPTPEPALLVLAVLLTATTCWLGSQLGAPSWPAFLLYLTLMAASPAFITWQTASLMDTALWGLLLMCASISTLDADGAARGDRRFSVLIGAMLLTRPESLVIVPIFIAMRAGRIYGTGLGRRRAFVAAGWGLLTYATCAAVLTGFRLAYFGYPFPNTYYAKVSPSLRYSLARGYEYLLSFATASPVVSLLCGLVLVVLTWGIWRGLRAGTLSLGLMRILRSDAVMLALIAAALLAVPVLNGGDHFPWWRMYQPVFPILAALPFVAGREGFTRARLLPGSGPIRWVVSATLAAVIVLMGFVGHAWYDSDLPLLYEFRIARDGADGGNLLSQLFAGTNLPSVGVVTAGGVKRTYQGHVVDLMGLNDTRMAHAPGPRTGVKNHAAFNPAVFFDHAPDMLWAFPRASEPRSAAEGDAVADFTDRVLRDLPSDPAFLARYRLAEVCRSGRRGLCVTAYYRMDLLDRLRSIASLRISPGERVP